VSNVLDQVEFLNAHSPKMHSNCCKYTFMRTLLCSLATVSTNSRSRDCSLGEHSCTALARPLLRRATSSSSGHLCSPRCSLSFYCPRSTATITGLELASLLSTGDYSHTPGQLQSNCAHTYYKQRTIMDEKDQTGLLQMM
jgi:hypothetical protein